MYITKFLNNQLYVNEEFYKAILEKYGHEPYRDNKIAIKTNNSFASRTIAEQKDDWYCLTPITSQYNERLSLQMETYWTLLKEFNGIKFGEIPQFYYQWFKNRGLIKEHKQQVGENKMKIKLSELRKLVKEEVHEYLTEFSAKSHGTKQQTWHFRSKSNPSKTYETVKWSDGIWSCNCPAWIYRVVDGMRICRHVESLGGTKTKG